MASKKLPKAVSITADEMRQAAPLPDLKLVSPPPELPRERPAARAVAEGHRGRAADRDRQD